VALHLLLVKPKAYVKPKPMWPCTCSWSNLKPKTYTLKSEPCVQPKPINCFAFSINPEGQPWLCTFSLSSQKGGGLCKIEKQLEFPLPPRRARVQLLQSLPGGPRRRHARFLTPPPLVTHQRPRHKISPGEFVKSSGCPSLKRHQKGAETAAGVPYD
jgi:hypothetical protein